MYIYLVGWTFTATSVKLNICAVLLYLLLPSLQNADCVAASTVHVDSFLYSDDAIDALCDDGLMSRNYCRQCGSQQVAPLSTFSDWPNYKIIDDCNDSNSSENNFHPWLVHLCTDSMTSRLTITDHWPPTLYKHHVVQFNCKWSFRRYPLSAWSCMMMDLQRVSIDWLAVCLSVEAFISHSCSTIQVKYIFQFLLKDQNIQTLLDVGSRTGALLYGVCQKHLCRGNYPIASCMYDFIIMYINFGIISP